MATPRFHLAVQYASALGCPARAQLRRWVGAALRGAHADMPEDGAPDDAPAAAAARILVRFVDADEAQSLNRDFRQRDYATNVLTFPYDDVADQAGAVSADLVICAPVIEREADEQGKAVAVHYAHMIVHGVLHACGYDHDNDADAEHMEAMETRVLARFGIADPYQQQGGQQVGQ